MNSSAVNSGSVAVVVVFVLMRPSHRGVYQLCHRRCHLNRRRKSWFCVAIEQTGVR
jgi:hypothetical protein